MPEQVGRIFAEATRKCIEIGTWTGSNMDQDQKESLCWKIIENLEKCVI